MLNKYFYSITKERTLKILLAIVILSMIGCGVLLRCIILNGGKALDVKNKKELIAKIPAFEAEIKMKRQHHMVLNGIVLSEDQYIAVINNTLVKKGDVIDQKSVVDIRKDYVVVCDVTQENKCIELSL